MRKGKHFLFALLVTAFMGGFASADTVFADTTYPSATEEYTPGITILEEPEVFSIRAENISMGTKEEISTYRLLMDNVTVQSTERVDTFLNSSVTPWITVGIKYIVEDGTNGDGRDAEGNYRWRYVYCLQHEKTAPTGMALTWDGTWQNRYVNYILYYGPVYYYETCRYEPYSTGNWRYDYLAAHLAITVVTGQYSLNQITSAIQKSSASSADENLLINSVTRLVNDAYKYAGSFVDGEGWFRTDTDYTSFSLGKPSGNFQKGSDGYYYTGWIVPTLTTRDDIYANSDITAVSATATAGVTIEKKYSDSSYSPYRLKVSASQYNTWQKNGKTITTSMSVQVPTRWGAGTYSSGNSGYQDVSFLTYYSRNEYTTFTDQVSFAIPKANAYLTLQKASSLPEVSDGNANYSLKGAVYKVYRDAACTKSVGTLKTDDTGRANTLELAQGTYYVKEETPPKGYALHSKVYTVKLTSSHISTVYVLQVKDVPQMNPMGSTSVFLKKVDADTNLGEAQNTGTLEGAHFQVKYYAQTASETDPASKGYLPDRTWIFATDKSGHIRFEKSCLVSGDSFYTDSQGNPAIPLGTVTIQEVKASEGYFLNEKLFVIPITAEGINEFVDTYQVPTVPERVMQLHLRKVQEDTDIALAGAVFSHTRPDGSQENITTDKDGTLTFAGLEWGAHIVQEITAPNGYQLNHTKIQFIVHEDNTVTIQSSHDETADISVGEDGNIEVRIEDKLAFYQLQITKLDEAGNALADAEFTLYMDEDCTEAAVRQFSDSQGLVRFADLKPQTTYFLRETLAPAGYRLVDEAIKIYAEYDQDGFLQVWINEVLYTKDAADENICVKDSPVWTICMNMINYPEVRLPNSGSAVTVIFIMTGTVFMGTALRLKRRNRRQYET